jgi:hypothetical protein
MASTLPYVARYRAAWEAVTRVVLGTGVGVVAVCCLLLLPWFSGALLLGGWAARHRLEQLLDEVRLAAAGNEAAVLLSVALPAFVGWTLLLGPAGAALVTVTLLGGVPLLLARLHEIDQRHAWEASERALLLAETPAARLWIVRQRASYLDDLERRDPERFAELTRGPTTPGDR